MISARHDRSRARHDALRVLAGLALAGLLAPTATRAEQPSTFQETLDVDLINLDVVVVDKSGNLVSDLGPDDFQVTDDGKKVKIDYFARLGEEGAAVTGAPAAGDKTAASASSAPRAAGQAQRLVLFLDLDSAVPLSRNRVLDEVSRYLDDHASAVSAMVATYGAKGLDVSQPFTAVPAEWRAAIDAAKEMPSRGSIRQAEERRLVESIQSIQRHAENTRTLQDARDQLDEVIGSVRVAAQTMQVDGAQTLRAVQTLASVLSTVPGPKSLIYIGDGVPMRPGEELLNLLADVFEGDRRFQEHGGIAPAASAPGASRPGESPPDGGGVAPTTGPTALPDTVGPMAESTNKLRTENLGMDLTPELRALTATANSHRVTIYGLSSGARSSPTGADTNYGTRTPPAAAIAYEVSRSQLREQALQFMADDTGGLALGAEAPVPQFLDRVLADREHRYSLAYVSPHGGDARFHKIKVKVARKGVELRHREGYIDRPRQVRVGDLVAGALLLGSGDNPHQFELAITSQVPGENDEVAVTLSLKIPIDQLHLTPAGNQHEAKLDLYVLSRDAGGALAPMRSVSFTVVVPAEKMAEAHGKYYGATLPVPLKKGPQTIAVGLVEPGTQRTSVARTVVLVGGDAAPLPTAPKS